MITIDDLVPFDVYTNIRDTYRQRAMTYRADRRIAIGDHITMVFENKITIKYQIQEIIYVEKIKQDYLIQNEIDNYQPLVSSNHNLMATMMIEYSKEERADALAKLINIEDFIYLHINDQKIKAIANEDLERSNSKKTSAVHFLRFDIPKELIKKHHIIQAKIEIDHPEYKYITNLDNQFFYRLVADLH